MKEVFDLINEMSPYLLLGFLLAGIMHVFVPSRLYSRYLAKNNFSSVVCSAIFGVPLPLCSCGVIPTAMSLRKEGASKGSTVSFLIATPQTGVDSIIATFSLMGLPFALVRPVAAFATALLGGQLVNWFDKKDAVSAESSPVSRKEKEEKGNRGFIGKIKAVLEYAFVDMMQDIGKWLIIGLFVAGLITVCVPDDFFSSFTDKPFICYLIMLAIAIPMYVCATGSIPIAVALMLKGLTPGAALVFLMAGPAANAASILVINKVLGRKTLVLYLFSIISGAILFALGIDYLFPRELFLPKIGVTHDCCAESSTNYFNIGCTILMTLLLINALVRYYRHRAENNIESSIQDKKPMTMNTYYVKGMTCNHCKRNVENAISELDGVEEVRVDLASGETQVIGDVSREDVSKAVESIGYELKD